ncbi:MAG: alanine racemase [Spirochaetes bacterium]|nr:alanine racemase [Spirochaetota bacterium]
MKDIFKKTYLEIDLDAVRRNLVSIRERVGNGTAVLLAVKADGYGHGAVQVSRMAEKNALADMLGVSSPMEGMELREAGINLPILNLGLILPRREEIDTILKYGISQTVADFALAEKISVAAGKKGLVVKLHLKIDTGMGRIGCRPEEAFVIGKTIAGLPGVLLEGVFTHFPVSDDPDSTFTKNQIAEFKEILEEFEINGIDVKYRHMANSAAILNYKESIFNLARPGITAYGYRPSGNCNSSVKLIPSMTFKSCVIFIKRVKKDTPLSYGLTYRTKNDTNIATVPVGYGDGYSRFLSNKGSVIIRGNLYPVAGRVCMDQILVDLGNDEYPLGEEVILFGRDTITAETIAELIGTIPYEVTCGISKRVQKQYIG